MESIGRIVIHARKVRCEVQLMRVVCGRLHLRTRIKEHLSCTIGSDQVSLCIGKHMGILCDMYANRTLHLTLHLKFKNYFCTHVVQKTGCIQRNVITHSAQVLWFRASTALSEPHRESKAGKYWALRRSTVRECLRDSTRLQTFRKRQFRIHHRTEKPNFFPSTMYREHEEDSKRRGNETNPGNVNSETKRT